MYSSSDPYKFWVSLIRIRICAMKLFRGFLLRDPKHCNVFNCGFASFLCKYNVVLVSKVDKNKTLVLKFAEINI